MASASRFMAQYSRMEIGLPSPDEAAALIPLVQDGMPGGPNITPCSGLTATEPAPLTMARVPVGATQSVTAGEGLKTYRPERCGFGGATTTLAAPTFVSTDQCAQCGAGRG